MAMLKKMIMLWICSGVQDHGGDRAKENDHTRKDGLAQGYIHGQDVEDHSGIQAKWDGLAQGHDHTSMVILK